MKWITSTDLAMWAPKRDCQEKLPLLIRKLIRASSVNISKLLFPSGDNIIITGWDGILESSHTTTYVPAGISAWEIGSGKDFEQKANAEYKKRSLNPLTINPLNSTFIFVTPYIWNQKNKWTAEKKVDGLWKDIQIIDGLILEEWLGTLPQVGAWLGKYLNFPENILPLDDFWETWSQNPKYKISPTLVLSGRTNELHQLSEFLCNKPNTLTIKTSTIEEAIAFIAAGVFEMDSSMREELFSRTIIIEDEQSFRQIMNAANALIMILKFETNGLDQRAVKNGHHVFLPVGNDITTNSDGIKLSRIGRQGFEKGLQDMGFNREEAERLTIDSGQSLSVLRRKLQFVKNQQPEWAKNGNHSEIIPAMFAGMWDDQRDGDKILMSLLAKESYENYISKLSRWKLEKDSPVFEVRSIWKVTSALDAWSILSPFLLKLDIDNFKKVISLALSEVDPKFDLEPDQRYLTNVYGKQTKYSYFLKQGLCQSLVLIAVFGETFELRGEPSPQYFADAIVRDLLFEASGKSWCSQSSFLPLLAEASPYSFLDAVENSLSKDQPPIMEMFGDSDGLFNSNSYYTWLLWALEGLAYSSEFLQRVTYILGELSRLDPGGKLVNRPMNSLRSIYIPWYNQTDTDFTTRKNYLSRLIIKQPIVSWELLLRISRESHSSVSSIHFCRWRFNTQALERSVSNLDVNDFYSFIFEKLLYLSKGDENKVARLINFYPELDYRDREKLLLFLEENVNFINGENNFIWDELRKLLSQHREHPDTYWALSKEELKKIERIYNLYTPLTQKSRARYLFEDHWPNFPEEWNTKASHSEREDYVNEKRSNAIIAIYDNEGVNGIIEMIASLTNLWIIGQTVATLNLKPEDEKLFLSFLSKEDTNNSKFVKSYIFSKSQKGGQTWIKKIWKTVQKLHSVHETTVQFFLALPVNRFCWELLSKSNLNIITLYWSNINLYLNHLPLDDRVFALNKLHEVNRHITAIDQLSHFAEEVSSEILAENLYQTATLSSNEGVRLDPYCINKIFEVIQLRNDLPYERQIQLEMLYIPFLCSSYNQGSPINLFKELSSNPSFFVDLISIVYLPDKESDEYMLSKEEVNQEYIKINNARKLLDSWRIIPGTNEDGTINKEILITWITNVRTLAKEQNRVYGVDSQVGKLLASYPRNKNFWPPEEICEVIDTINSNAMVSHFKTEVFNSRGTYSKAAYEGGNQERALSAYFDQMGEKILSNWPVTASILFKLAKGYTADAKREDDNAHLEELR